MESPLLGEVSFLRRRYEALGAWHGLSIPRANKREAWGGGGVGVGVLSICHCHAVTENTALGQWGRRGGEAQGQGAKSHPGSSPPAWPGLLQARGLGGWGSTWDAPCHGPDGALSLGPWRVHLQGTRECSWRFHCQGLGLGHDPQCGQNWLTKTEKPN